MTRDALRTALEDANVRAFLRAIRNGESSQDESAYRLENGGRVLPDHPIEHPSKGLKSPPGRAFGAYQFLASTWAGLVRQYGFEDMSPQCQDEAAVALIYERRGALEAVLTGRFDDACRILHPVWTSLPGGSEENRLTAAARRVYTEWGGQLGERAPPAFDPDTLATEHYGEAITESTIQPEAPMAPIVLPLLQIAAQFIPQIAEKFGSGSEVANRNLAAGKVLADAIVTATKSPNLQAAVEKMASDPEAVKAAKVAVAQEWPELFEVGGGVPAARKLATEGEGPWHRQFLSIPFAVIVMLMPIIYFVIYHVVTGAGWTQEIKASVVSAVISGVLFAIVGFALGTSFGSQRKTNLLANKE